MRDLDIDLQCGNRCASVDAHAYIVALDCDLTRDSRENLILQDGEQIGLAARDPLVGEQDLQPLPRHGRGALAAKKMQDVHAALRPNSLPNSGWCSDGMLMGSASPLSRRAASR